MESKINKQMIEKLISENLEKIFGFAMKRTEESNGAEDLMQDILLEVYKSYEKIKYYEGKEGLEGWLWTVAKYTYYKWLSRKNKNSITYIDGIWKENLKLDFSIDEEILRNEEYNALRREISLLSKKYREVVVSYYVHEKKCSEIAEEMGIPIATVKWRLYEAKRMLKDGMKKVKNYTEKTYSPGRLSVLTKGTFISPYSSFYLKDKVKSLLRQNILIYASKGAVTIEEMSLELGVPRVYLEEEIEVLINEDVLKKVSGDKYRTNFLIVPEENQKVINLLLKECAETTAKNLIEIINKSGIKKKEFMWIIFSEVLSDFFEEKVIFEKMPVRPHGNNWRMLGFEEGEIFKMHRREVVGSRYSKINLLQIVNCEENSSEKFLSEKEARFYIKVVKGNIKTDALSKDEEEIAYRLINKKIIKKEAKVLESKVTIFSEEESKSLKKEKEDFKNEIDANLFEKRWNKVLEELYKLPRTSSKKELQQDACTLFDILYEHAARYVKENNIISNCKNDEIFISNTYFVLEEVSKNE